MIDFLEHIRTHFNIIHRDDYLSLTLINPNISVEIMKDIKQKFKFMNHIRKQEIIILETSNFDDQLLVILAQSLPSSLTELTLDFTGCESIKGSGFLDLFQRLSTMQNLTKLHLDFSQIYDINDFVIEGLSMLLETLQGLTDFYLDLYEVDQISEDGYLLLAESLSHLQNLTKFHLDVSANPNLTQDALQLIFSGVSRSLTSFGFRILDIQHIGGGSFFKMAQAIAEMKQLNQLNLTISTFLNINHKGTYSILKAIGSLPSIQKLLLNFSNINLPQKMLAYMTFPQKLESLIIDVSCNSNLTDRDIVSLCQKISNKNKLNTVGFNFDFCKKISEDAIETLVEKILESKSILKISLPDRKYSTQFLNSCVQMSQKRTNPLLMFTYNAVQDLNKSLELKSLLEYKQRQKVRRNIIFSSLLMKKKPELHSFEKDVLKLFLPA